MSVFLNKNRTKLTYSYEPHVNEIKLCPEYKVQPLAAILDKHNAMIREEIKREIEELTRRIEQIQAMNVKKFNNYEEFVDKFKPKKTTDDCYTPPKVYQAVLDYVMETYQIPEDTQVIRPFFPGGDYENAEYPEGCIVVDNPPFSIFAKIVDFYLQNGIKFFLFAPSLTALAVVVKRCFYLCKDTNLKAIHNHKLTIHIEIEVTQNSPM